MDFLFGVLLLCRNNNNSSRQVWTAQNSSEGLEGSNLAHEKKKQIKQNERKKLVWAKRTKKKKKISDMTAAAVDHIYIYIYIYIFFNT